MDADRRRSKETQGRRIIPALVLLAVFCAAVASCGRKGPVRPPELVVPQSITDLRAQAKDGAIALEWRRPQTNVGGDRLDDLGGFRIERATGATGRFEQIATVPVTDRERFRKVSRFRFDDREVSPGTFYRYRVVSFTVDRYASAPSNLAEIRAPEGGVTTNPPADDPD